MKLALIALALLALYLELRRRRRRNTAEALIFRILGTDGSPRAYDEFAGDHLCE